MDDAYNPKLYIEKKCCQTNFAAGDGVASRDQEARPSAR